MTLAINDAGDVLTDTSGKWLPAPRAVNDTTGESLVHDGAAWKPVTELKPQAEAGTTAAPAPDMAGRMVGGLAPAPTTGVGPTIGNIIGDSANAAAQAYQDTPALLTPEAQESVDKSGPIGRYITNPLLHIAGAAPAAMHALGAGIASTVSGTADALGQPALGRDINMGLQVAPVAAAAHLGVLPKAEVTPASIADGVMAAPTVGDAINVATRAAGGEVATAAVNPQLRLLQQTEGAILRRVDGDASRLTDAENTRLDNLRAKMAGIQPPADDIPTMTVTAPAEAAQPAAGVDTTVPAPESVGAAASRDLTPASVIEEVTPAQKATALQKMVNQSAEDRLTPGGRDDAVYVPGVERPEAMKDFSPGAEGGVSGALAHKTLYNTDSDYHDRFDAQVKKNNNIMVDKLHDMFGDANARDAAMNEAKELMPGPVGLFNGERPVNAQPVVDAIHQILAGPAGKRGGVASTLGAILPKLYEGNEVGGALETLPSMLKGVRDDITDKLYDKSPTVEGNAARTSANQLRNVLAVVDQTIGEGLPGTRYQDYLSNLSAALAQVSKLDYLQRYLTGTKKLTDLSGNLLFDKVQKLLEDIQAHHADQTGGAKELTPDEISQIEAVRNELAAKDLLDKRAAVRGSPTPQITNAAGMLGSGPLGAGVKGAAEAALHVGLAATTHGLGNAALGGYRYIIKPAMDAAKARQEAAILAATKQRLLDITPRLDAAP